MPIPRKSSILQKAVTALVQRPTQAVAHDLCITESLAQSLQKIAGSVLKYQASGHIDFTAAECLIKVHHTRRQYWLECFRIGEMPHVEHGRYERASWNAHSAFEKELWRLGYDFLGRRIVGYKIGQEGLRKSLPTNTSYGDETLFRLSEVFEQVVEAGSAAVELGCSLIQERIVEVPEDLEDLVLLSTVVQSRVRSSVVVDRRPRKTDTDLPAG